MRMMARVAALLAATSAWAQTPVAELAKPPADAARYTIASSGGVHGRGATWRAADGTLMGRESLNLRGQVWETDSALVSGRDGLPVRLTVRGVTPRGDAAETFVVDGGTGRWKSEVDAGSAPAAGRYYNSFGGTLSLSQDFIERLVAAPGRTLDLLPGGRAKADRLTTLEVGEGARRKTITAWAVTGTGPSPFPMWTDAQGKFFGVSFFLASLPEGYEGARQPMEDAQNAALARRTAALARELPRTPKGPVAFTDVRLFDAAGKRFLDGQTVVVEGGTIRAVGPRVAVPAGAEVIDGRGKTLLPGLWDCHAHISGDYEGLQELSLGVTSIRDPGNNNANTIARRARAAKGELLFPNVYASSLIDGKGPYTAQVATAVGSEAEAVAAVTKAKADGFTGVKFYGTFDPKWLPAAIGEAKRLGLHVHGHVPAGIRPMDAIKAGYDELTHINWVVMQAVPDAVIKVSNGIARFEGPGRHAKDMAPDDPALRAIVAEMAAKRIVSDPTMVAFEGLYVPDNGELSPAYAPFVGTLPPATERGFRTGGFKVPPDLTRADYRASWARMVRLLGDMHRAGVPIVAGTDGSGIELVRELEIYREAGMTNAEALATATINAARMAGAAKKGVVAPGMDADLVLVEGDPSVRLSDLRQTRVVMLGGRLLDADALRTAAGYSGRPKG